MRVPGLMAAVAQAGAGRRRERELQAAFEAAMQLRRMRPPESPALRALKVRELDGDVGRTEWLLDDLKRQGWSVSYLGKRPHFGKVETFVRVGPPTPALVEDALNAKPTDETYQRVTVSFMGYTKTTQVTPPLRGIAASIRAFQTPSTEVQPLYPMGMRTSFQLLERRLRDPGLVRRLLRWLRYDAKRMRIADARDLLLRNLPAPLMLVRSGTWALNEYERRVYLSGDRVCALSGAQEVNREFDRAVRKAEIAARERDYLLRGPGPGRLP